MPGHTVFISYSHENKRYLEELRRVLETVPRIDQVLWFDQRALDIGAQFHPAILQAMTESRLAIFLLSTDFFALTISPAMNSPTCCARPLRAP